MVHKFSPKKTPELLSRARALYREGWSFRAISLALKISHDTARRWLDAGATRATRRNHNPEAREPSLPTLPFVPHIQITGRYQMRRLAP